MCPEEERRHAEKGKQVHEFFKEGWQHDMQQTSDIEPTTAGALRILGTGNRAGGGGVGRRGEQILQKQAAFDGLKLHRQHGKTDKFSHFQIATLHVCTRAALVRKRP